MKAVAFKKPGPIDLQDSLCDITLDKPKAQGKDLLVKIHAISVNPVDTKVRNRPSEDETSWKVLGYDAAGIVEETGPEVSNFKKGDAVFYAGSITRPGTNTEYHLVDERIVGHKPESLSFAEAAALPLTSITAWEMLFDRLNVKNPTPQGGDKILIIGGAGGVGSITIQLLKAFTDLTIIATASRPETKKWVQECGAHYVIDHNKPLAEEIKSLGCGAPGFVFSITQTEKHYSDIVELIAPQGRFGLIDDAKVINAMPLKLKSISLHWELMFTRSMFETSDIEQQGKLLNQISKAIDEKKIKTTLNKVFGKINATNLREVHAMIESGTTQGKIVLEDF